MSAAAAEARVAAARRPRPALRPRARRHVSSGVAWIVVFGVLLAGVVGINVAGLHAQNRPHKPGHGRGTPPAHNPAPQSQAPAPAARPGTTSPSGRQTRPHPAVGG